jgi:hypothetical protein
MHLPPHSFKAPPSPGAAPGSTLAQLPGEEPNPQLLPTTAQQALAAAQSSTPSSSLTIVQLLGDLLKLPLFPANAQQEMTLAQDKDTSLEELSNLVEFDVTLTASILKLANSRYSHGPTPSIASTRPWSAWACANAAAQQTNPRKSTATGSRG